MEFSFPKKEHLCLKRRFDALLDQGKSFFIYPFRVIYLLTEADAGGSSVQVAISVRKKQFKHAVTRNLIKRRFRESWRMHKAKLNTAVVLKGNSLYLLFVYGAAEVLPFSEIDLKMLQITNRLCEISDTGNVP